MGMKCFNCGKGAMIGRQHTHHPGIAGKRWKKRAPKTQKIFKPNLHSARIPMDGMTKRVRLCTKCLRIFKGKSKKSQKEVSQLPQNSSPVQTSAIL